MAVSKSGWIWTKFMIILALFLFIYSESFSQNAKKPFTVDLSLGGGLLGNPDLNSALQPEFDLSFIPGRWGVGLNTGFLSYQPSFNGDIYRAGFEEYTAVIEEKDRWNSFFIGLGPRFEFDSGLPVQFKAGLDFSLNYNSPPELNVIFEHESGIFSDHELKLSEFSGGDNYRKWSAAVKPEFQVQFFPGRSQRLGFHVTTGVQHRLAKNELTYSERDLSEVMNLNNVREMYFQFESAPVVQRTEQPPRTNFFVNAGIKIKFGGGKTPAVPGPVFTETTPAAQDVDGEIEVEAPGEDQGEGEDDGKDNVDDETPEENAEEEEGNDEEEEQDEPEELFVGLNGEFEVENLTINAQGNNTFSGNGTIFLDWIKSHLAVEFEGITVDPNTNRLTSGEVTSVIDDDAPLYSTSFALQVGINTLAYNHQEIADLHNWMVQQPYVEYNTTQTTTTPIEAPFGMEIAIPDYFVSVTELVFQPNKSELNAAVAYNMPADWNNADMIGFAVKELEFHPDSIQFAQGRLEIVSDLTVGNANNDINFTFLAPDGTNVGTFIEWENTGFTLFGIELQSEFTRDWLLPVPDNGTDQVAATLSATGTKWNDFVLTGNLDKAEIVGAAGITIEANTLSYDMSDSLNPAGIEFPDIYTGVDTTSLWRGFYAKNFTLGLPESIETHQSGPPEIGVNDLIIDHQGLTMQAFANNVFQYPNASVADLNASVDSVQVNILTNSLVDAWIKGKVAIPATHPDSLQNPLNYHGLFATGVNTPSGSSFQLTIDPDGPIYTNMLKGMLTLEPSSTITAMVGNGEKSFDMLLNGDINWANIDLNPITNINMGLEFAGLGFDYNSNSGLNFNMGAWSLASPQKFMHNFPVTFQNINFTPSAPGAGQLLKGSIGFTTVFNLSENLGGQTSMGIDFAIDDDSANFKKFSPVYEGLTLDSLSVSATLKAVNINGSLFIENDDPVFGKRVGGNVQAEFTGIGLNIEANAQFGNTVYQNAGQLYRYWQVDVQADFPDPGIAFLPGIAFRGFGGGAYNNMEVAVSNTGERSFTPLNNMFGFNAGATIATTPEEKGFNADITLMGEFSTNGGGMTYVGFNGDFGTGSSIVDRRNGEGKVFGNLLVDYVFPTKNFTLAANANINTDPIKTIPGDPFNLTLNIDGLAGEWSFKAGVPTNTNNVEVLGINLYEYLMLGNAIPIPNGFTNTFASKYAQHFGYSPNNAHMQGQVDNNMAQLGAGFAMGLGFEFEASGSKLVYEGAWRDWSIAYDASVGAELHLSFLEYASCSGFNEWGINGWRAGGGFGFYAAVSAQAEGFHRNNGVVDKVQNLATLKAGGYIAGKFPKPVYASGAVSGSAEVLSVFNVSFHQQFQYGTNCAGSPVQPNVTVVPGDAAADFEGGLIAYMVPLAYYGFPAESPVSVKYGLTPDEQFSVPETQANGTIQMRTFKLEKMVTLEKNVSGAWQSQNTTSSINNLGEYQYIKPGPPPLVGTGPVGLAPGVAGGGMQTGGGQSQGPGTGAGQQPLQPALSWNPNPSGGGGIIPPYQQAPMAFLGGSGTSNNPPNYGNLPPEPPPPVNNLDEDSWYRFTVDAVLMELVNGNWVTAADNSGNPITQSQDRTFFTGIPTVSTGSTPPTTIPSSTY